MGNVYFLSAQSDYPTPRMRVSLSGGMGYLTATGKSQLDGVVNQDVMDKATKNLRIAKQLNGDIYLLNSGWGFGVKYLFQKTSAEAKDLIVNEPYGNHYLVGDIAERNYVNFVGPSLLGYTRLGANNNIYLVSSLSFGYAMLRGEGSLFNHNILITGGNMAMNSEIGVDYLFHRNWGVGANLGFLLSSFNKVKVTDGIETKVQNLEKDARINLSNIYLSLGLRYYLNK